MEYGFLRETSELAEKAGIDKDFNVCRTGLNEYLDVIFPEINDWIHNKTVPNLVDSMGKRRLNRPDYRSETLKLIVEFDGLPHYQDPEVIRKDEESYDLYKFNGYTLVRIPYFVQLTNDIVEQLFGRRCDVKLFDPNVPSMGLTSKCTPAYLCIDGIKRMAKEYKQFPQQYEININYLKSVDINHITGYEYLEKCYQDLNFFDI